MTAIDPNTHSGSVTLRVVDPLNLREILAEGDRDPRPRAGLPAGTTIGHLHLQVSDTDQAANFYSGVVGFAITAQMPGAIFASAGGYHHHLGLNSWSSRGGAPNTTQAAGLEAFVIEVPSAAERDHLAEQVAAAGYTVSANGAEVSVRDPWNIEVVLRAPAAGAQPGQVDESAPAP